ncbi:PAS domain S-box protein [Leptospira yasudae]|uniref:histidine kinase n=1 Tax=Leptospira yasudae TaxID=2202201 RepID=A0ABX9LYS1_9LEPT|nr:PAS domain-containing protein [Leptospira yasudae]RHX78064.1 PAS domain-containing sensor histidine kinase [Leptospira yasudae]TGK26328.1 PAS domain S-box protein [Leptospira yasudae]TGM08617.1 PAS domain S-box protein [Leptospira yasudae]
MLVVIQWLESIFESIPLPILEIWGRTGFLLGFVFMISAFSGVSVRFGEGWTLKRERQSWNTQALLSIPFTFVLIFITGYLGSFIVLVPGAQTFESLKDLSVFLCVLLFGYPALIAVPFAYGLSDLIEGVPPHFLFDWLVGYFINPACFWIAYRLIGRNPDFTRWKTWLRYLLFVAVFMVVEPQLWGYICSKQFSPSISYRNITPALFFTTSITWVIAPFAMMIALPLARKYGMFWAEIPGHVRESDFNFKTFRWERKESRFTDETTAIEGLPIRMLLVAPFILLVLVMVGATAYLNLKSSEMAADKLAGRLHQEISENINLQLDQFLEKKHQENEVVRLSGINDLLKTTNVAAHGRAIIVDRFGQVIGSSKSYRKQAITPSLDDDPVIRNAIQKLRNQLGNLNELHKPVQFQFDVVTAKPLALETWMTQATPYEDNSGNLNWILITAIPSAYYLEGVRIGSSQSAMVFAVALTSSLLIAAFLAGFVTAPIRRISNASRAMARGDFAQRVPASRLEELGSLSVTFNHMAEQLQESFRRTKASEEQFRDLVDTTPGIVWEADAATFTFTFVSQQVVDMLGYQTEEWKQPGFWAEHLHPDDREWAVEFCISCTGRMEAHDFEYRFMKKDGSVVWLRDIVKVIVKNDQPKWLRGVMVDVTEKKQIEEKLVERNQFIESILDITPDILYIYDIEEKKNVYSNNGIEVVLGYTVAEIQSMGDKLLPTLMPAEDFQRYVTEILPRYQKASDKDIIEHEYRMLHSDGKLRWLVSRELIYQRNRNGGPKQIFGIIYDITKSKEAEETILDLNANLERKIDLRTKELRKSNADLRDAVENLKRIMKELKGAQDQLLLSEKLAAIGQLAAGMTHELNTPLGAITSSNRAILEILQKDLKEVPQILAALNKTESESFNFLLEESLKDAIQSEVIPDRSLKKQFNQMFKNAGFKDYEDVTSTVLDIGVYRLGERLVELLQSEKRTSILAAVGSLSTIVRLSNVISVASGKASHVVEALKNYLNPGGSDKEEDIFPVDIKSEIETILTLYHTKIKYGVEIVKDYRSNGLCLGNGNKLNQVWINLLNNGLQSMNYQGKIEICLEEQDSWVITSFTDSGAGIPDEVKDKIFEPFFTTKKQGEGIGLGLDICKKIIEKMGGKIEFESVPGRTKFSVWLKTAR